MWQFGNITHVPSIQGARFVSSCAPFPKTNECYRSLPPSLPEPPPIIQEDHQTQVETAQQRVDADRPVGRDFIPLSQSPQLSQITFGRKSRRSSPGVPSSESTAIEAAARGGGGGGGGDDPAETRERLPLGISPSPAARKARRSRLSAESSDLAVVGAGATGSNRDRRASAGMASASSVSTTVASLSKEYRQRSRLVGRASTNRGEAGRVNDDHGGGTVASASPELLYASGRITAGRYHEMLAEIDRRGIGGSATARKAVQALQRRVSGARRGQNNTPAKTSVGHA